jgi:hypothetical protein
MTDSTMIERVSRALCTAAGIDPQYWSNPLKVAQARAAIEALMEPTPALLAAQTDTDPDIARVVHENRAKLYSDPF